MRKLPTWELLAKKMTWEQLEFIHNMRVLDFGSGYGVTANYFAEDNDLIAIEPNEEMIAQREVENNYVQLKGSTEKLKELESESFNIILCHNVLEYASDRDEIVREFYRLLKPGGKLSVVKHNRSGRVMQMVVLLNNFENANKLLDGGDSSAEKYGDIHYYEDCDLIKWCSKFSILSIQGMRTFWDLQQNQEIQADPQWQEKMLQIERRVSYIKEYQDIAFFHHLILEKS